MKKIFIIWWWVDASNYKGFEEYLINEEFNPYEEKVLWWKDNLQTDLWECFEVIKIPMPNKFFAEYKYWKIMFQKATPYFSDKNILIWHSLGWSFLLKYLEENSLENISQIHLIAPAVFDSEDELLWSFKFDEKLEKFKRFENIVNVYHSKDDDVVDFWDCLHLQKALEKSNFEIFENVGHFIFEEHIEELVRNIKK
jgi:predicted alpha/beta hydrolase family esterase